METLPLCLLGPEMNATLEKANENIPPFVTNIMVGLMTPAIIALFVWTNSVSTTLEGLKIKQEIQTTRVDTLSIRGAETQRILSDLQIQIVRDLQSKGEEIISKIEKSDDVREVRVQAVDNKFDTLVEVLNRLSSQVAVIAERVDIYIQSGHPTTTSIVPLSPPHR